MVMNVIPNNENDEMLKPEVRTTVKIYSSDLLPMNLTGSIAPHSNLYLNVNFERKSYLYV